MIKNKFIAILLILSMAAGLIMTEPSAIAAAGDPVRIEAEDYSDMSGIETEECSEGGLNVGYVDAGDWMDYLVDIPAAGTYTARFRVSSPYEGTRFQLLDGGAVLATLTVPNTGGWQNWETSWAAS